MLQRLLRTTKRQILEEQMTAIAVIRMPGEGKEVTLAGQPMAFLVTGENS